MSRAPRHAASRSRHRAACALALAVAGCVGGARRSQPPAPELAGVGAELALQPLASGVQASLRGLDVVDDRVAWASGSEGHVGLSRTGGESWTFRRVGGYEDRDFRDVEAFSPRRALVIAVGSPGLILETTDGGASWTERFRDERPTVFLDAIDCLRQRGSESPGYDVPHPARVTVCLAFGDPIDGRFLLLRSDNGGRIWREIEGPAATPGEAAFAASGTALRFGGPAMDVGATSSGDPDAVIAQRQAHESADGAQVVIGAGGGEHTRVLVSNDLGRTWHAEPVPLAAGAPSRGVFSLAWGGGARWVAVGGDHLAVEERSGTAAYRADDGTAEHGEDRAAGAGAAWRPATELPRGYRSAVERLRDGRLIATGPNGTDLSEDGGANWRPLTAQGFHAVRRADDGELVLLVGADGRIARLTTGPRG